MDRNSCVLSTSYYFPRIMEQHKKVLIYLGEGVGGKAPAKIQNLLRSRGVLFETCLNFSAVNFEAFDMIIFPGGSSTQQYNCIREDVRLVQNFVKNGGGYLGFCAGSYLGETRGTNTLGLLPISSTTFCRKSNSDLSGMVSVRAKNGDINKMKYHNGPIYDFETKYKKTGIECIGVIEEAEGESLCKVKSKMRKKACIVKGNFGKGTVILSGPHPEATEGLEDFTFSLIMQSMRTNEKEE